MIVAGQSNALGYTLGAADLPPHLRSPIPDVWIWSAAKTRFEPLRPGSNTGSRNSPGAWGPEAQFAWRWRAASPCGPLYIVKHARGETGLASDPAAKDWSPTSAGELFEATAKEVFAAKASLVGQGLHVRTRTILWMQGETDAGSVAKANAYETNLATFIVQARARWQAADAMFQIGQIGRLEPGYPGNENVRQAQARIAGQSPNVTITDTAPFPRQSSDHVHMTADAQVRLGDEFFDALLARGDVR